MGISGHQGNSNMVRDIYLVFKEDIGNIKGEGETAIIGEVEVEDFMILGKLI